MKFNSSYVFGPRIFEKGTENRPSFRAILLLVCNTIPTYVLTASILQCIGHAAWIVETNACMFLHENLGKQPIACLEKDGRLIIKITVGKYFVNMLRGFQSSQLTDFCVNVAEPSACNKRQLG